MPSSPRHDSTSLIYIRTFPECALRPLNVIKIVLIAATLRQFTFISQKFIPYELLLLNNAGLEEYYTFKYSFNTVGFLKEPAVFHLLKLITQQLQVMAMDVGLSNFNKIK